MNKPRRLLPVVTIATLFGLPVLYVASFGPACRCVEEEWLPRKPVAAFYDPIVRQVFRGNGVITEALKWYGVKCGDIGLIQMGIVRGILTGSIEGTIYEKPPPPLPETDEAPDPPEEAPPPPNP